MAFSINPTRSCLVCYPINKSKLMLRYVCCKQHKLPISYYIWGEYGGWMVTINSLLLGGLWFKFQIHHGFHFMAYHCLSFFHSLSLSFFLDKDMEGVEWVEMGRQNTCNINNLLLRNIDHRWWSKKRLPNLGGPNL